MSDAPERGARPIDRGDWNMAYLFPEEVAAARERIGLVILPIAPLEWHGPHMVMGTDPLLAHAFARRVAAKLRCPYFPALHVGTEYTCDSGRGGGAEPIGTSEAILSYGRDKEGVTRCRSWPI